MKTLKDLFEVYGWTRYASARDNKGKQVRNEDPLACEFCILGAIRKSAHELCSFFTERRLLIESVEIKVYQSIKEYWPDYINDGALTRFALIANFNDSFLNDKEQLMDFLSRYNL